MLLKNINISDWLARTGVIFLPESEKGDSVIQLGIRFVALTQDGGMGFLAWKNN